MIFVDEYKVQICGTPELNLMEGIVLMRALVDTNPELKSKEAREKYFKEVMKFAEDDDLEVKKIAIQGRIQPEEKAKKSKPKEKTKKSKLEERRNFRNGTNSNTGGRNKTTSKRN